MRTGVVAVLAMALATGGGAAVQGGTASPGSGRVPETVAVGAFASRPAGHRAAVSCQVPAGCQEWADRLAEAERVLDPVLPAMPVGEPGTRLVVPTASGQEEIVGKRSVGSPTATTLVVSDHLVRSGIAPARTQGETWIVVNPRIGAQPDREVAEILAHELVHVRTRAPRLPGATWVEEGYAVALVDRAFPDATVRATPQADPRPGPWPPDDWAPRTWQDYSRAGGLVADLADTVGWPAVHRWYADVSAGTSPTEGSP